MRALSFLDIDRDILHVGRCFSDHAYSGASVHPELFDRVVHRERVFRGRVVLQLVARSKAVAAPGHHRLQSAAAGFHHFVGAAVRHDSACGHAAMEGQAVSEGLLEVRGGHVLCFRLQCFDDVDAELDEVFEQPAARTAGVEQDGDTALSGEFHESGVPGADAAPVEVQTDHGAALRAQILAHPQEVDQAAAGVEFPLCDGEFYLLLALDQHGRDGFVGQQVDENLIHPPQFADPVDDAAQARGKPETLIELFSGRPEVTG